MTRGATISWVEAIVIECREMPEKHRNGVDVAVLELWDENERLRPALAKYRRAYDELRFGESKSD